MAMSRAKMIKSVWREFTLVQALFVIFIGRKPASEMEHQRCGIELSTAEYTLSIGDVVKLNFTTSPIEFYGVPNRLLRCPFLKMFIIRDNYGIIIPSRNEEEGRVL